MTFDSVDALMINRGNRILRSKQELSQYFWRIMRTLLVLSRSHFDSKHYESFFFFYHYIIIIYDWITILRYSKHDLCTINMLYSLKIIII